MRPLVLIATCLLVASAEAQSAGHWMRRWRVEQQEASVTLARIHMTESALYRLDGAFGPREFGMESDVVVERGPGVPHREATALLTDDKRYERDDHRRRRGFRPPVRSDLLREADALLFPYRLLSALDLAGNLEVQTRDGREVVRVATVPERDDMPIRRVIWLFDRGTGELREARAIIRGPDRATIVVDVTYARRDGLDVAVSRRLSGSFAERRRMRTFTILVEAEAEYEITALESLEE